MKLLNLTVLISICFLIFPELARSQSQEDTIITIEEIYTNFIPKEVSSVKNIVNPNINYSRQNSDNTTSTSVLNSTIINDIINDFKSDWEFIIFNDIIITEVDEGNILVTGSLSGKNYEQGVVNFETFQHTWLIQNGVVIKFLN